MAPVVAFLPLILAGVSAAITGIEMSHMPKPPSMPTQATNETQRAREQQAAAQAQAQALMKRRGMSSTIMTSPLGVSGGPTQTQTATLGT